MDRVAEPIHSEPEAETTVGLLGDPMIHAWAGAADVAQPLALVTSALGIRTEMQAVLFRGVLDALGQIAPILGSWDLNGSQTYGTAKLAAAWQRRPQYLDVMLPPKVDVGASSDKDFETDIDEGLLSKEHGFCCDSGMRASEAGSRMAIKRRASRTDWLQTRLAL